MIIFASSTDSLEYYPDNANDDFRLRLSEPLQLQGEWVVSLVEIYLPRLEHRLQVNLIDVCSPLCRDVTMGEGKEPVLRRVDAWQEDDAMLRFERALYVPVAHRTVSDIHIYLRDVNGGRVAFLKTPTYCTLDLTRIG